jgi:hypothetical protein
MVSISRGSQRRNACTDCGANTHITHFEVNDAVESYPLHSSARDYHRHPAGAAGLRVMAMETIMLRRFLTVFVIVLSHAAPARALDPAKHIMQYAHTAWRTQDGAFNSAPWTIVQTPDGYMWIGTSDGVPQFGVGVLKPREP